MQYMYSNEGFKLKRPKIILSIMGGAKKLNVPSNWKKDFKAGLIKAAKTANAWIITGGLNAGISKLVGDAISEEISTDNVAVIGVCPYGAIEETDSLSVSPAVNKKI